MIKSFTRNIKILKSGMNLWRRNWAILGFIVYLFIGQAACLRAEGSKQLSTSSNIVGITINGGGTNFGGGNPQNYESINIYIKDASKERIYLGFGKTFTGNDPANVVSGYFKILDRNKTKIYPSGGKPFEQVPSSGAGFISSYSTLEQGPFGGFAPLEIIPSDTGNFTIYFNLDPSKNSSTSFTLEFLDITVAEAGGPAINGRVWSNTWVITPLINATGVYSKFYIINPDDYSVSAVEFNGIKSSTLVVYANKTGYKSELPSRPEASTQPSFFSVDRHKLYFSVPDVSYPTGGSLVLGSTKFEGCAQLGHYFVFNSPIKGFVEIYLDFNNEPGFQENTKDIKFLKEINKGVNSIKWDEKDGLGNQIIDDGVSFKAVISLVTGITNLPLYEAFQNPNGLKITSIKSNGNNLNVFWDDSKVIPSLNNPTFTDIKTYAGCSGPTCHSWTYYNNFASQKKEVGEKAVINTWWYWILDRKEIAAKFTKFCPPIVNRDYLNIDKNKTLTGNNLGLNDSWYAQTTYSLMTQKATEQGGISSLDDKGNYTYTPPLNFVGTDYFIYEVCNIEGSKLCDTALVTIEVKGTTDPPPPPPPVYRDPLTIPTGFSPNNDGRNDYFEIVNIDQYLENNVKIFNRWGELVFQVNGYNNTTIRWDGKSTSGGQLPAGTYYYVINKQDGNKEESGYIILFR